MPRKYDTCMFCGEAPCVCNKPAKSEKPKRKKPAKPSEPSKPDRPVAPEPSRAAADPVGGPGKPKLTGRRLAKPKRSNTASQQRGPSHTLSEERAGDQQEVARAVRAFANQGMVGRTEAARLANITNYTKPTGALAKNDKHVHSAADMAEKGGGDGNST